MRQKFVAASNQFVTVSVYFSKLSAGKNGDSHARPCPNQPILPAPGGRNFRPPAAFLETSCEGGDGAGRVHRRSGRVHHFVGIGMDWGTTMTSVSTSRECPAWHAHLTRPVRVRNGPILRTLNDLRAFIRSEPKAVQERKIWQCASELLLAAGERDGDIGAVTEKVELALFLDARLLPVATASLPAPHINAERARRLLAAVSVSRAWSPA